MSGALYSVCRSFPFIGSVRPCAALYGVFATMTGKNKARAYKAHTEPLTGLL